jgi:hypothetical protein
VDGILTDIYPSDRNYRRMLSTCIPCAVGRHELCTHNDIKDMRCICTHGEATA